MFSKKRVQNLAGGKMSLTFSDYVLRISACLKKYPVKAISLDHKPQARYRAITRLATVPDPKYLDAQNQTKVLYTGKMYLQATSRNMKAK